MRRRIIVGSAVAATSWYAFYRVTRWRAAWGRSAGEAAMVLPGDDLVPTPTGEDTRAITIDAPPDAVWPWLIQMGYGRAGWYSYDRVDMKGCSADRIVPELQSLAVGDVMPTDPGGGFEVRAIEPERSLVLYLDDATMAARTSTSGPGVDAPGLAASGAFLERAMTPQFRCSWAFVLKPVEGGRTRLIERTRVWFGAGGGRIQALLAPVLGFGVFVMMRRQMLGIRARAERWAAERPIPSGTVDGEQAAERLGPSELRVVARGHAPEAVEASAT